MFAFYNVLPFVPDVKFLCFESGKIKGAVPMAQTPLRLSKAGAVL